MGEGRRCSTVAEGARDSGASLIPAASTNVSRMLSSPGDCWQVRGNAGIKKNYYQSEGTVVHQGFNLKVRSKDEWLRWKPIGEKLLANSVGVAAPMSDIEAYVKAGVIDGAKLQASWFGTKRANVFISHSHRDKDLAVSIAGWLHEKFGLLAFVDSCVWGHANDLQKKLDIDFCKNPAPATTYDYDKRNRMTGHVHMMLSTALIDMIDNTECFLFLHTDGSIVSNDVSTSLHHQTTTSPWIYAELKASSVVREKPTGRAQRRKIEASNESILISDSVDIEYPAELRHLRGLDESDLRMWGRCGKSSLEALDILYESF